MENICGIAMKTILISLFLIALPAAAIAQSFAVKGNAGSLGIGGEAVFSLNESFNVRAGANVFDFSYYHETSQGDEYDIDANLHLNSISALIDWYPFQNGIRLAGGIVHNRNEVKSVLIPKQSHQVGGDIYSPEELGNVEADFRFPDFAPYFAIGLGNPFQGSRFGVNADIGILYQGDPKVDMRAEGLLAPSANQAEIIEQNISWANIYPAVTLSLYYRFK